MSSFIDNGTTAEELAAEEAAAKATEFYREVWSLLGVAFLVVVLRTYGRMRSSGFRSLQADDYMVWLALVGFLPSLLRPASPFLL